ncbi:MAG: alpha/beta fold hydrolase [Acidimicrobiales bacterium]
MDRVISKDGTPIAYERYGDGPAVILVGGAIDEGSENAPLVPLLAEHFTVFNYARRGRAESGDTTPYAIEREIEDLEALVIEAGGSAHVFGASSGGALSLEAAAAGVAIDRLAVYELPYNMDPDGPHWNLSDVGKVNELLAEGRRGDVVELFMRTVGTPEEWIEGAKGSPVWPSLEALAHTLAYDAACVGDGQPPTGRLARITQPTLVATGGAHEDQGDLPADFFDRAADAVAAAIPNAERLVLEGQSHMVDANALGPKLEGFFSR